MANKSKITVTRVSGGSKVYVTGKDASSEQAAHNQIEGSVEIEVSDIDGSVVDIVGGNRFIQSDPTDFQLAVTTLKEVFTKALDAKQAREASEVLQTIEFEKKKQVPNLERVSSLIEILMKLASLAQLAGPASDKVMQIIEFLKRVFTLS